MILGVADYTELGTVELQLWPHQTSIWHNVSIVNDDVTEIGNETFALNIHTDRDRVVILAVLSQVIVTINDDDSK